MILSGKNIHTFFEAGVVIKAIDAFLELALGVLFLVLSSQTINSMIFFITGDELSEQPRDTIWNILLHGFTGFTPNTQFFWALIFLMQGAAKVFLVIGLMKEKMWIFPAAAAIFSGFVVYQVYHLIYFHSILLSLLTIFDVIFVWLILKEYAYQKDLRRART